MKKETDNGFTPWVFSTWVVKCILTSHYRGRAVFEPYSYVVVPWAR